jgi:hypothetical protein
MLKRLFYALLLCSWMMLAHACTFSLDYKQGQLLCNKNEDCPLQHKCTADRCVPLSCKAETDCPRGFRCQEGQCTSDREPTPCTKQEDCATQETCQPASDEKTRVCVVRCNAVTQTGCPSGQVCVLFEARAYCRDASGNKPVGLLCEADADCENHLFCRSVSGFPFIKRCTSPCDLRDGGKDCPRPNQRCLPLTPIDQPMGYCEPIPIVAQTGGVCGGDIICPNGTQCSQDSPAVCR